ACFPGTVVRLLTRAAPTACLRARFRNVYQMQMGTAVPVWARYTLWNHARERLQGQNARGCRRCYSVSRYAIRSSTSCAASWDVWPWRSPPLHVVFVGSNRSRRVAAQPLWKNGARAEMPARLGTWNVVPVPTSMRWAFVRYGPEWQVAQPTDGSWKSCFPCS